MNKKTITFYSEAFKMEVVKHYETTSLNLSETSKLYGIKGGATLRTWLRKYGHVSSINKIIRVEKPDEKKRMKELEAEIRQLKEALADAYVRQITAESTLEVVAEMVGVPLDELKKKPGKK